MAIITISRLTGSGGREIATATARALHFQLIDRNAMDVVIDQQFPVRTEQLSRLKKDRKVYDEMVRSAFARIAASLHVQIVAPLTYRIARVMHMAKVDRAKAEKIIEERDREKEAFLQ